MPKKLNIFSLKIYKGAGIFKNPQNLSKKGTKHKKIIYCKFLQEFAIIFG